MKVESRHDVVDRVWIKDLRSPGRVMAALVDRDGLMLSVRWFKDGEPKTAYFVEDELGEPLENEQAGFQAGK